MDGNSNESLTVDMGNPSFDENLNDAMIEKIVETNENSRNRGEEQYVLYRKVTTTASTPVIDGASCSDQTSCSATLRNQSLSLSPSEVGIGIDDYSPHRDLQMNGGAADTGSASIVKISTNSVASGDDDDRGAEADFFDAVAGILADDDMVGDPVDSQELLNRRENNDFLDGMPHSDELNTADILLNHDQPFDHSPCEIDRTLEEAEDELLALLGTDSFLSSELIFPAVRESQFDAISHEVSPCVATITYSNEDFDQRDIDIYRKYEEVMEKSISETRRQDISTMGSALATIASFPPGSGPSTPVKHNKIAAGGELVPSPLADALERSSPEDSTITGLQENTRQLIGDALGDGPSRETEEPDVILFQSTTYPWDALGSGPSIPVKGGETGVQAGRNACLPENIPDLPTNAIDSDFPAERLKLPGSHETFKSHDCDGPMIGQAIDNILDYETPQHVSMTTDWVGGTSVSGLSVSKGNGDACIQAEIDASLRDSIPTKSSSTCSSPENMSVTEKDIKLESQGIDRKIIGDIPVNVPRCETLQQDSGTAESVINAPGAPVLRMSAPMKDENAGVKAEAIATSLDRLSVFALDAPGCAQPQSSILLGHHQDVESEENGRQITNDVTVNMPRYETQQYDSVTVDSSISASDRHVSGLTSSKNEDDDDAVADSSYPGVLSTLPTDLHDGDFRDGPAIPERQEFQDYGGQPTDGAVDYMSCDPRQQVTCAAVGASDSPGSGPSISEYSHDTMAETKPRGIPEACLSLSAGILDSDPPESPPLSGKLRAHISQDNRGRITSDDIPSCDTQQRVSGPTDSVVKSLDVPGSDSSSSVIFEKSFVESDPDSAVADELPTGALNSDLPKVATVSKRQELLESQNSEKLVTPSCETELLEIKPTDSVSPKSDSLSSGLSAPTEGSSQVALDVSCLDGLPSSLTDTLESELQNKSPESTTHESIDSRACNCRITGAANCYIPGRDAQEENPVTTVSVVDSANCNVLGLSSPFEVDDLAAISEPDAFLREGRPALSTDTLDIDLSEKSSIPDNDKASETQDIDCQSKDGAIDHIPHSGMGQQNRKANYLSSYAVSSGPSTPVRGDHSFTRDILDTSLPHGLVDLSNDFELDVGRSKTEMHETRKEEETGNDTCNTPSPSQLHFSVTATSVTTVPDAPDSGLSTPLKGDDATVETKTYSSLPRDLPDSSPVNLNIYSLERSEVPEYFDKRYDIEGENAGFICNANFDTSCSSLQLQDKPDDSTCIESDDSKTKSTPVKGTTCTVTAAEPNSVIPNARPCSVTKSMDDCLPRSSDTCDDSAATTDEHRSEAEGQDILASNSTVDLTESDKSPDHPSLNGSAVPLLSSGGGCESFCETRKPGFVDNASTSSYDSRRADSQGAAPTTGSGATDVLETHLVHSKVEIPEADNDAFLILDTFENGTNEQADDGGKVATTPYHVWDQMTWAETPEQGRSSEKEAMSQSGEESALPYHFLCVVDDDQVSGEPMHINPDDRSQGEAVPIPSALHCLPGGGRQAGTASAQARSTADEVVDLCSEIDTTNTLDDNSSCSIVTPTLFETPHIAPQSHRQGSLSCSDGLEAMNSQSTLDSTKSIRAMLQRELESLGFTNPLELPSLAGDEDMLGDNLCRNVAADENTPVKATGPEYWPLSNEKERRRVTLMPADYASADDSYCVEAQPHTSISVNLEELGDETKGFSGIKMDSPIPTVAGHVVGVVKRLEKSELDIARKECTMVNYENGPGEADPLNSDEGSTDRRAESTPKDGRIDFIPFPTQGKELYKNPDDLIDFLSRKLVAQKASDNVDSSGKQKGATLALFHASSSVFANEDDTWGSLLLSPPGSPVEPSYARDDSDSVDSSSQGSEIERSAGVLLFPPELCVWDMIADHSILSHSHPEYVLLPDHPRRSTTVGNQRSDDIAPLDLPGKKASGPAMTAAPGEIFRPSITHSRPSIVKRESFASLGSRKRMSLKTVIPHSEKLSRFWRRKGQVPALPLVKSEEIPPTTDRPENEEQETLSLGAEPKKNCGFPHFGSDQIHKSFSSNDLPGFGSNQTEGEIGLVENLPYSTTIAFETSRRKSLPPGMKASFPSPSSHRRNLSEHIFGTSEANGASPYVCIEMTKEFSLFPRFDDDLSDPPGHDEIDLEEDLTRFSSVEHLEFPFQYDLPCHARFYAALRWQQIISCWQHEEIAKSLFKGHYLNHGKSCNTETESIDDTCLTSRRTPVNEDHETMNVNGTLLPYITGADRANLVRTDSMTFSSFSRYFYVTRDCIDTDSLKHNLQQNVTDEAENLIALAKSHCADFAEIVEDVVRFAKQNFESVALGEDYDELDQIRFVTGVKEKLALEKKAKRKYGGDVLQVRDVLRASVVFPSEGSLVCGLIRLSLIEKDTTRRIKVEIVRVKNLLAFESPLETMAKSPLPTGYRHVLVNIRLNGGILAEIQCHLSSMYRIMGQKGYALHHELVELNAICESNPSLLDASNNLLRAIMESLSPGPWEDNDVNMPGDVDSPRQMSPTGKSEFCSDGGTSMVGVENIMSYTSSSDTDDTRVVANSALSQSPKHSATSPDSQTPKAGSNMSRAAPWVQITLGQQLSSDVMEHALCDLHSNISQATVGNALLALIECGCLAASTFSRDVSVFNCLYMLFSFVLRYGRSRQLQAARNKESLSESNLLQFCRVCLLRCFTLSCQATSVGMVGWLEYGESNQASRIEDGPAKYLSLLASSYSRERKWKDAESILQTLILKYDHHLPSHHSLLIASFLDLAAVSLQSGDASLASASLGRAVDRVAQFLVHVESSFLAYLEVCSSVSCTSSPDFCVEQRPELLDDLHDFIVAFRGSISSDRYWGSNHFFTYVQHSLLGDALAVLANCWHAAAVQLGSDSNGTTEKRDYYWRAALAHYRKAFEGFSLSTPFECTWVSGAALGMARCLRELGSLQKSLELLSLVVTALECSAELTTVSRRDGFPPESGRGTERKRRYFLSSIIQLQHQIRSEKRQVQHHVIRSLCLWLMSVVTIDQNPNENGRGRAFRLLHAASVSIHLALSELSESDYLTRISSFEILEKIENEAKKISLPV